MGKLIENFINNFQDMYIVKNTTIDSFPDNITGVELKLIDQQLESIKDQLNSLSELCRLATEESAQELIKTVEVLESKIDYVTEVSNVLMYINSFYDMANVVDIKNYDLKRNNTNGFLVYDNDQKGLTLRNISSNFQCAKSTLSGSNIVFYNTNLSYHSGISLESPYLNMINIKAIVIRKSDGTVVNIAIPELTEGTHYIKHEFLNSTQISVEFSQDISTLPPTIQQYYNTLNLSLIDYKYLGEGSLVLPQIEYDSSNMFNLITDYDLPNNCYINNIIDIDLLDMNNNIITSLSSTLPVGLPTVCKRLDLIDFNIVENISGIYINNTFKANSNKSMTQEYLKSLSNKNEIYIIFEPKRSTTDQANKFIKLLNNQGFVINRKNVKRLRISMCLEMFSFNEGSSPLLKTLVGVTKNE